METEWKKCNPIKENKIKFGTEKLQPYINSRLPVPVTSTLE